jgi:tight adherence protein B
VIGRRWSSPLAAGSLAIATLLSLSSTASAADPVTVSISEVKASGDKVTGVLTVRSRSAVQVEPASLTASVDGDKLPISIEQAAKVERRAMLVIDTSGSMGLQGMATVRAATASYLSAVPSDVLVGVVSFANTAGVDLAPTTDRAAVQEVANGLVARGNTSLYAGMRSATKVLGAKGDRSIVLLSDGADTVAANQTTARREATQALKDAGIRVDVVRFKSDDPDAAPALQGFASANGGSVVSADNTAAVVAAFRASAKALETQVPFEIAGGRALTGSHTIELKGVAGGTSFRVSRVVDFTASAAPAPAAPKPAGGAAVALPDVPKAASQSWFPAVAAILIALGLFGLAGASLTPSLRTHREERVGSIEKYVVGPKLTSRSEGKEQATPLSEQLTAFGEKAMQGRKASSWILANVERADLPFRAGDWFLVSVASAVIGSALGFLFVRGVPLLGMFVGAVLGLVLPQLVLRFLANRRAKNFEAVLPDVMMLVATSLRSGFGLPQALDAVARDAAEPAAKEFSRALAETRIGTDVSDALEHAATRMGSKALDWTVMAIRIQRDVGGNLSETLMTTAATLRERESLFRQVRALSAEGRISAYILIALPIGMFFYMMFTNYAYISLLWTNPMGLAMVGVSIVMLIVGVFWMRKTVKIEV